MHDHSHQAAPSRAQNRRRLAWVLALSFSYMLAEVAGGILTGSLALLADAGHMLSDVAALSLSLFAIWMAQRPATPRRTYGHSRAEILAALAQGVALVAVAIVIVIEAIERLEAPPAVNGPGMLAIASGGLVVNAIGLLLLNASRHSSLNLRGAWLHVASDALGSMGAISAGVAIWAFGWRWADPAASLAISALVLASAWHLLREAVDVLMETAPSHLDIDEIRASLRELPAVVEIHDLHVWTIGSGEVTLSSHVVTEDGADAPLLLRRIYERLAGEFGIDHTTIQIEPPGFVAGSEGEDGAGCVTACQPAAESAPS